jgi:hypothetical protein
MKPEALDLGYIPVKSSSFFVNRNDSGVDSQIILHNHCPILGFFRRARRNTWLMA